MLISSFDKGDNSETAVYSSISSWVVKFGRTVQIFATDKGKRIAAAILFPLSVANICTVLPNFTTHEEIDEYTAVSELSPLSNEEISKIDSLWQEKHSTSLDQPFSNTKTKLCFSI